MTDTQSQSCNEQIENNDDCSDMSLEENDEYYIEPLVVQLPSHNINKFEEQKMSECNINQELVNQLLNMEVGSKHQIINAMNVVNDRNDMNQLLDYLTFINERCETSTMKNSDKNNLETFTNAINEMEEKSQVDHEFKENININYNEAMQFKYDEEYPVLPLIIPNNCVYDENTNTITKNSQQNRNTLKIHQPAIEFIRNISAKIATISISGPARQGKSLVAGELYAPKHIPCPFDLGHTMDACTYGVWVSAKPIKHPHEQDTVILIFDCEGTGYHQAKKQHDMQLMIITLLLSSYFIYNTIGTFDADALDELEFVTELTDCIKVKPNDEDGNGLEYILPKFMWLLRDSHLEATINGKTVPVKEYFTKKVLKYERGKSKDVQRRQTIRSIFMETFTSYDAFKLPHPHSDTNVLKTLGTIKRDKLEPQFNKQLDIFCKKVMCEAKCKVLFVPNPNDNKQIDQEDDDDNQRDINQFICCRGTHLAAWIEQCIEWVNDSDKVPEISSMTTCVMRCVFRESKARAIIDYKQLLFDGLNELKNNNENTPLNEKDIIDLHLKTWNGILTKTGNSLQSFFNDLDELDVDDEKNMDIDNITEIDKEQLKVYREFCVEIGHNNDVTKIGESGVLKNVLANNMSLSEKSCTEYLNIYFIENIKPMLDKPEQFEATQIVQIWKELYNNYHEHCIGPAKMKCWKQFENSKRQESVEQFQKMKGYSDDLARSQHIVMEQMKVVKQLEQKTKKLNKQKLQQQQLNDEELRRLSKKQEEQEQEQEQQLQEISQKVKDAQMAQWKDIAGNLLSTGFQCFMAYKSYKENTKVSDLEKEIFKMKTQLNQQEIQLKQQNESNIDVPAVISAAAPIVTALVAAECLIQ
eukprot:61990_1